MVDPVSARLWLYRLAFVGLALAILIVRILPVGSEAGTWPGPDLMLCLMLAWVNRRPDYLPALLIAAVVLVEDLILMRPPGLWAAIVLVATEFLRSRAALTRELGFVAEWLMTGIVMVAMLLAYRLAMALAFLDQPPFAMAFAQVAMTILCYPLVTGLLHLALQLRKPLTGEVDAFGRRL
ncbi:MAG TPA: rod shape-determining protein MreD [Paracoccaceae bacterium]|nr:rod shape-determining protein MreD [Paracoccaceae bacterium]HMO72012.1 rod shape-determining protein MreD [Paracoccaceae bacterium]